MLGCAMRGDGWRWLEVAVRIRTTFAGTSFISSQLHSGPALTAQTEYSGFKQDLPQKSAPTSIPRSRFKMYSHESMKSHAILRIETILIDLTFIKLKTRIIT